MSSPPGHRLRGSIVLNDVPMAFADVPRVPYGLDCPADGVGVGEGLTVFLRLGEVPPFGKLIGLRYLPLMVVSVIPIPLIQIAGLIDALFIFRADRRCVHDLMAGTRVIVARTPQVST